MDNYQFFTLMGMMAAGFGWLIHQVNGLDRRLNAIEVRMSIVETILAMMGLPIKAVKGKTSEE